MRRGSIFPRRGVKSGQRGPRRHVHPGADGDRRRHAASSTTHSACASCSLLAGIAARRPASAFYICADSRRRAARHADARRRARTRVRVGIVRGTLELCALAIGIVLGGTFGVGTVLFALLVGPDHRIIVRTARAHAARGAVAGAGSGLASVWVAATRTKVTPKCQRIGVSHTDPVVHFRFESA